ncbi:MAG UNVERIFIED_CONTAM: ABC transporter permease [Rickettsiaceae bacterium]|jgi:putative ABC transport system permease protein
MNVAQYLSAVEIGLFYSLVAIGVFITLRIINFPDLTVDGSFTLGAATSSILISMGFNPLLSISIALFAGILAGASTGYMNVKWKIPGLLASILVMTALYSINMRIMGKPNISISDCNIFDGHFALIYPAIMLLVIIFFLYKMFTSQFGLAIRAIGINPKVCPAYGIEIGRMQIFAIALSNGIVALAGACFAIDQGFADISMGAGTIVSGLAAVIIGEALIPKNNLLYAMIGCAIGSILYRIGIGFALNGGYIGLQSSDINLITTIFVIVMMVSSKHTKQMLR